MTSPQVYEAEKDQCISTSRQFTEEKAYQTLNDERSKSDTASRPTETKRHVKLNREEPQLCLPEGWIALFHQSGGVLYLHKPTRVVTWSRPYALGRASAKKHNAPSISIPCFHQVHSPRKMNSASMNGTPAKQSRMDGDQHLDENKSDDVPAVASNSTISSKQLTEYLARIYEFEDSQMEVEPYHTSQSNSKAKKHTDLIASIEALSSDNNAFGSTKLPHGDWNYQNWESKSPVSVLNEYAQIVLRSHPQYEKSETNCGKDPYVVEVVIGGVTYGRGTGSSTKVAKRKAAEHALTVLAADKFHFTGATDPQITEKTLGLFDKLDVADNQIYDMSNQLGLPTPATVLATCCERNKAANLTQSNFQLTGRNEGSPDHQFEMTCGSYSVTGHCKSRKIGRQLGAQLLLKEIHPHIHKWGSLLRLYGSSPPTEKSATSTCASSQPQAHASNLSKAETPKLLSDGRNVDMLTKLKAEMRKLAEIDDANNS